MVGKALYGLEELGERAAHEYVLDTLLTVLKQTSTDEYEGIVGTLIELGSRAEQDIFKRILTDLLSDPRSGVRIRTLIRLQQNPPEDFLIDLLVILLDDEEPKVRELAMAVMGQIAKRSAAAAAVVIPLLTRMLTDSKEDTRVTVAQVFGVLCDEMNQKSVAPLLLNATKDSAPTVRAAAIRSFGNLDPADLESVFLKSMVGFLEDEDEEVRYSVVRNFEDWGESIGEDLVIAALIERLQDEDGDRHASARALGVMGARATTQAVFKALAEACITDDDELHSSYVGEALHDLGTSGVPDDVFKILVTYLQNGASGVERHNAAKALGSLKEKAASEYVLKALVDALKDIELPVRLSSAQALGKIGEKAARDFVIEGLLENLVNEEPQVRAFAAEALAEFGEAAADDLVIGALLNCVETDPDEFVRNFSIRALGNCGEKAIREDVFMGLLRYLYDDSYQLLAGTEPPAIESLWKLSEKADVGIALCALKLVVKIAYERNELLNPKTVQPWAICSNLPREKSALYPAGKSRMPARTHFVASTSDLCTNSATT